MTPGPACTTNADALTPVVCLPDGYDEDQIGQVVLGGGIDFSAQIVNNGPAVTGAKLVITLPPQLRLSKDEGVLRYDDWYDDDSDEDGTDLGCTVSDGGATVTCETGPLNANVNTLADITLDVTDAARAGTTATFTTALQPETEDAFPTTQVSATVAFLEPSRLAVSVTPDKADVVIGRTKNLAVTVRNIGKGESPNTFAVSVLTPSSPNGDEETTADQHFAITNAPEINLPGDVTLTASAMAASRDVTVFNAATGRSAARAAQSRFALWPIGTVAPGGTAKFTVTVKALSKGINRLLVAALSPTEADKACDDSEGSDDPTLPDPNCVGITSATLTAVAAPPASSSAGHAPDADAVANTGVNDLTPQLMFALLALLVGAALTVAGRTRRCGRHGNL